MWAHPSRAVVGGFGLAVLAGAGLLSLPAATVSGNRAHVVDALFTAASAICVTGLVSVDTGEHWSVFGELVIMALIQIGGLGIMSLATLLALVVSGRLGLQGRLLAQAETKTLSVADVKRVLRKVVVFSACSEAAIAAVLTIRFMTAYEMSFGQALYQGGFHSVSAFNNGGFSLWPDSLTRFAADPWILLTIALAVILGGIGFPVVFELARGWRRPSRWSVLTRVSLLVTGVLLTFGFIVFTAAEWNHALAPHDPWTRVLNGFFVSAMTRSGGFNTIDITSLSPESILTHDVLMFIGGGSAGTAGGIKITTFGLLGYVIWAELRGEPAVRVGRRAVPSDLQRQALTIALLSVGMVTMASLALISVTDHAADRVVFEVISAFGTVGLSTGVTSELPRAGQLLLVALMFAGRVGPLTLGSALALRERARRYELPEERTIVG